MTEPVDESFLARFKRMARDFFKEGPRRKKPKTKAEKGSGAVIAYSHYSYKLLGGLAEPFTRYFEDLRPKLLKAGLKITLRGYVSMMLLVSALALLVPLIASLAFGLLFRAAFAGILLLGGALGLLSWAVAFLVMYTYPSVKACLLYTSDAADE